MTRRLEARLADQGLSASASQQEMEETMRRLTESEATLRARIAEQTQKREGVERQAAEAASRHSERVSSLEAGIFKLKAAMEKERAQVRNLYAAPSGYKDWMQERLSWRDWTSHATGQSPSVHGTATRSLVRIIWLVAGKK